MTPLDVAQFSSAQVAEALGRNINGFLALLKSEDFRLPGGEPESVWRPGKGRSRNYTARQALFLAVTDELMRRGFSLAKATELAPRFTHMGGRDDATGDDPDAPGIVPDDVSEDEYVASLDLSRLRAPGRLDPDGRPLVFQIVTDAAGEVLVARIVLLETARREPWAGHAHDARASTLIDLDDVWRKTLTSLGVFDATSRK